MWQYVHYDELYHYGVPGMKWGHRRALRKMAKLERKQLKYQDRANRQKAIAQKVVAAKSAAADKMSGKYTSQAAAAMKISAAKTATKRGEKAAKAMMKSEKYKRKIDKIANKKQIDYGKSVADYILKSST